MKKIRNHFLILFGLLLFGIFSLAIGTSAKAFPWLSLTSSQPTTSNVDSKTKESVKQQASKTNQLDIENTNKIYVSPIGELAGIVHVKKAEDTNVDSDVNGDTDSGSSYEKSITNSISPITTSTVKVTGSSENTGDSSNFSNTSSADTSSGSSASSSTASSTSSSPSSETTDNTSSDSGNSTSSSSSGGSSSHSHHTVAITSVSLDKTTIYFPEVGDTSALKATVSPPNTTESKSVTWSSADDNIATVDKTGKVTAVKGGKTKITVNTVNGKTAVCNVTVRIPATKVTLNLNNETEIEIEKGSSLALSASLEPANTTDEIKWTTSDSKIITADSSGKITAVNAGTATITAAVGGVSAECKVTVGISITKIKLSDTDLTLKKSDTKAITATIVPPDTTENKTITWSSSNDKVAAVDENGNITAIEGGSAIISAQTGKHISQCNVIVTVPLTGIKFDPDTITVAKDKTETLSPIFTPVDATDKVLTWGSSNTSIATVDSTSGTVTGVSVGTTTITAIAHDGGFAAQCTVDVVVPVTGIAFDKTSIDLIKGKTDTLTATITPTDATDKQVSWKSSNTNVATVDNSGKITAVGGGSALITVTTHDGGYTAKCDVTVTVPVTGIKFDKTRISLMPNATTKLTATINPYDATDTSVTWKSSNTGVATVDSSGKITAVGGGSAVITATTHDGGFTTECDVTVTIPVTGIKLNQTSLSLKLGQPASLSAIITPTDATNKAVTWTSSNEKIATVSSTGYVKAVGEGQAVISAKTQSGGYTAQCSVNCIIPLKVKTYCGKLHYIKADGSFGLEGEAGTNERARGEETVQDAITFEFSNAISYTKGSTIVSLSGLKFHYDRCYFGPRNGPFFEIYADDKLVYKSDGSYFMRDSSFEANCDGNFKKLKLKYTGIFYKGKDDHTKYPGPGYFELEVPSGGLSICGQRITNVYVEN